ncbi:PD-(D/E)XK nuclease-like domain-containing protein [Levilactobacillus brevis]|uniref:PD-(D/E)XK nuclease-like domain-containing protein n=1 Tax=Levilactobacillus brevis TaxID=1580 RepID=UPI002D1E4028|nr:PD-(D/E)XK nuclease-like domain-containing protein [Levilactobacillus brevis]
MMQAAPKKDKANSSHQTFILNSDNYYSQEANKNFMSPTWFKKFVACEAEALAELRGEWAPDEDKTALLVGNDLHSYFESSEAHERFLDANKEVMLSSRGKTKGQLKSEYKQADIMIDSLKNDKTFTQLYQGEKESIVTGVISGAEWMGKLDCLNLDRGYFIDLKTTQELSKRLWDSRSHRWVPFVLKYDYQLQMAVYRELVKQQYGIECEPYIVAVTKQSPPNKAVITIPHEYMEDALQRIDEQLPHFEDVIAGVQAPVPCGSCAYCREHKQLENIISVDDLLDS